MKALCWHGKSDIRYETVPDPKIQHPQGAIIKVTACAICGSDLHIFDGVIPQMQSGDVLGHETMGDGLGSICWLGKSSQAARMLSRLSARRYTHLEACS